MKHSTSDDGTQADGAHDRASETTGVPSDRQTITVDCIGKLDNAATLIETSAYDLAIVSDPAVVVRLLEIAAEVEGIRDFLPEQALVQRDS